MSNRQNVSNPRLRRVNATGFRLNHRRECIMRAKVLPEYPYTEGVTYEAFYSRHHRLNYIWKDTVTALGWHTLPPAPSRTINPRGGVFKPIGWIDLYLQQPNSPFDWKFIRFHVVDEPLNFDLIIGEVSCAELLGEAFDFEQFNRGPEEYERQRQYAYALWEQQQLEALTLEGQEPSWPRAGNWMEGAVQVPDGQWNQYDYHGEEMEFD
ncbi:hypothetical protein B0T21DRAFT_138131 [Apiosordaria backusii]|uniref:Uncharacterized protein n=1 Tax=Apiosordaria backusii TaxID=314023 RepID=A0AA40BRN8_9PEZI|nr:hypothetical protein B0T21DRAFT_138131 [Apiosordaria backusii]